MYDLVKQVRGEVRDFLDESITITSIPGENNRTYDYNFSQRANIALIDLYWNSQFASGKTDAQGLQKLFMNVGRFRTDVAEMQIDIDVSNFLFIPTGEDYWTPYFMSRDFHDYVREHDYGELINDWGADLPRYGTAVSKRVGDEIRRVPLKRLMNTQNARSLKEAAKSGGYVIEVMELTPQQMEEYPDWNLDNLVESDEVQTVYERYGLITEKDIAMARGEDPTDADGENFFLGVAVVATDVEKGGKDENSALLFAEKIEEDEFPYEEVHWSRQDDRWQGIGVMEEQFQNQLAKNLTTHYRQKTMYWAGKKMFAGTNAEDAPNNLAMEVKDGGVIHMGAGGTLTPINTQTQHLGDINAMDAMVDNQADQMSFTYEAATGDSPKSGTPYSLQVQVDNTLQKHFGKKKERFGAFLRRIFFNQQVEIFKRDRRKEHTLTFKQTDDGYEELRMAMVETHAANRWLDARAQGKRVSLQEIRQKVEEESIKSPYQVVTLPKGAYDNAKYSTDLILTGERRNMFAEVETLKTLLADARQTGDQEGAAQYLREIMALTGRRPSMARLKPATEAPVASQAMSPAEPVAPVNPNP